jgi:hypothetical protein
MESSQPEAKLAPRVSFTVDSLCSQVVGKPTSGIILSARCPGAADSSALPIDSVPLLALFVRMFRTAYVCFLVRVLSADSPYTQDGWRNG